MMRRFEHLRSKKVGMLTANFSLKELNHSSYATKNKIKNVATGDAAENQAWLAIVLQLIRDEFAVPIEINSGFRNARVNAAVGGVSTSAHKSGEAADIVVKGYVTAAEQKELAYHIAAYFDDIGLIFDQIIYYKKFVHVGMRFRKTGRKQIFAGK